MKCQIRHNYVHVCKRLCGACGCVCAGAAGPSDRPKMHSRAHNNTKWQTNLGQNTNSQRGNKQTNALTGYGAPSKQKSRVGTHKKRPSSDRGRGSDRRKVKMNKKNRTKCSQLWSNFSSLFLSFGIFFLLSRHFVSMLPLTLRRRSALSLPLSLRHQFELSELKCATITTWWVPFTFLVPPVME